MEHIKKFKTQDEFLIEKPNLPYPCVSYVEETQNVEYTSQSIITAKYNITQDFIDYYTQNNLTEIQIYGGEGLLKSYTINGETHVFEEPKYQDNLVNVEFNEEIYGYIPSDESYIYASAATENMTFSTPDDVNFDDYYICLFYYRNDNQHFNSIEQLQTTDGGYIVISDDLKSFKLNDFAYNKLKNEYEYMFVAYREKNIDTDGDVLSSEPQVKTYVTFEDGTSKEMKFFESHKFEPKFEYAIDKQKLTTDYMFIANRELDKTTENDLIVLTMYNDNGDVLNSAILPLFNAIEFNLVTLYSDNKTVSFTQESAEMMTDYVSLTFCTIDDVSPNGQILIQIPSIQTSIPVETLINADKISPSAITVPIVEGELDVKYVLCNNATETGYFSMYSNEMPSPLCEIDLSKLDKEKEYKLSDYAFYCAISMSSSFTIPNTITTIGSNAFKYCSGIKELNIHESLKFIGSNAFEECTKFSKINIPSIELWCKIEFENEFSNPFTDAYDDFPHLYLNGEIIENFVVPETITSIKPFTFCHMYLDSVVLHNSIKSIGSHSFYKSYLGTLSIPDSVTRIGEYAFYKSHLREIAIPSGVTSIGDYAFAECTSLISITSYAVNAPTIYNNTFYNIHSGGTLTVPNDNTTSFGGGSNNSYNKWLLSSYGIKYTLGYYNWKVVIAS